MVRDPPASFFLTKVKDGAQLSAQHVRTPFQGRIQDFHGEGLQVLGGALLATEGAPLPFTVTMHYNENYEMLVTL